MTSYWGDSKIIPPPKALPFKESLLVLGKLLSDPGSDIMMGQDINMRDSISMQMLQQPCRALGCKHIQCFDFEAYLHINKSRPSSEYSCPICNQVSNPSKIYVDTIFLCLLKILPEDSNISIMKDGRFDIRVNQPQREIIVVDDDDDEDGFVATTSMSSSSGILQCTGSVVELSYIVPFTTSKSKKNRTSLTELTTASLDDVLHLMNVENAWGVNSIPGSTMELQKCIRAKRPFASSSNDGLKYLLQQVDGVGTVRAGKIVEHFYKILQGKLNGYLEFIQARSLFQENSLNLSLSSPIIVEFLKKMGRLKPVSEPPLPSTTAASPTKSSKSKSKSKRIKDTSSQQEEADNLSMPPPAAVASNSYIDVEADAADTGSSAAAATASRKRANSVISVASSAYESELESAVVITSQASQPSQPAYQQDSRVLHYSSQSAAAGRAKGSSAICGEGIADVAILPKLTRRHSSGSIAQDSDVLSMSQRNTVIDLSDSNDAAVAESVSPVGSPNSKNSRNPSSPSKRRGHKRRRSEDSSSIPQVSVSSFSSGSSSGGGGMDVVMEEADVVTFSSASVQGAADASRHRRRRVGVVDVDADDDLQVRGPFMQTALGAVSSAATVSSTSSAERSVSAEAAAPADAPKPAPTPAEAPIVPIMAAVSMSRAAPPMQAPGGPSSSSDASSAARRPASSTASVRNTASSQVAARVQQVGNQLASPSSNRQQRSAASPQPQGRSRSDSVQTSGSGNSHIRFHEEAPPQHHHQHTATANNAGDIRNSSTNNVVASAPNNEAPFPKAAFPKRVSNAMSPLTVNLIPSNGASKTISIPSQPEDQRPRQEAQQQQQVQQPQQVQQRYQLVTTSNGSKKNGNSNGNTGGNQARKEFSPRVRQSPPLIIPPSGARSPPPAPPPRQPAPAVRSNLVRVQESSDTAATANGSTAWSPGGRSGSNSYRDSAQRAALSPPSRFASSSAVPVASTAMSTQSSPRSVPQNIDRAPLGSVSGTPRASAEHERNRPPPPPPSSRSSEGQPDRRYISGELRGTDRRALQSAPAAVPASSSSRFDTPHHTEQQQAAVSRNTSMQQSSTREYGAVGSSSLIAAAAREAADSQQQRDAADKLVQPAGKVFYPKVRPPPAADTPAVSVPVTTSGGHWSPRSNGSRNDSRERFPNRSWRNQDYREDRPARSVDRRNDSRERLPSRNQDNQPAWSNDSRKDSEEQFPSRSWSQPENQSAQSNDIRNDYREASWRNPSYYSTSGTGTETGGARQDFRGRPFHEQRDGVGRGRMGSRERRRLREGEGEGLGEGDSRSSEQVPTNRPSEPRSPPPIQQAPLPASASTASAGVARAEEGGPCNSGGYLCDNFFFRRNMGGYYESLRDPGKLPPKRAWMPFPRYSHSKQAAEYDSRQPGVTSPSAMSARPPPPPLPAAAHASSVPLAAIAPPQPSVPSSAQASNQRTTQSPLPTQSPRVEAGTAVCRQLNPGTTTSQVASHPAGGTTPKQSPALSRAPVTNAAAPAKPRHLRFEDVPLAPTAPRSAVVYSSSNNNSSSGSRDSSSFAVVHPPAAASSTGADAASVVGQGAVVAPASVAVTGVPPTAQQQKQQQKGKAKINSKLDTTAAPTRPGNEVVHPNHSRSRGGGDGGCSTDTANSQQQQQHQPQSFAGLMTRHFCSTDEH